jgi:hypothetical protein
VHRTFKGLQDIKYTGQVVIILANLAQSKVLVKIRDRAGIDSETDSFPFHNERAIDERCKHNENDEGSSLITNH